VEQYIKVMKALADPTRIKILKILQVKGLCVCEIRSLLCLAQPTISKHLKLLEGAGLVESYKEKMWVHYSLAADRSNIYVSAALENLHGWLAEDHEVKSLLEKLSVVDPDKIRHHGSPSDGDRSYKRGNASLFPQR
jgi:ArsR family transcriptional regulator